MPHVPVEGPYCSNLKGVSAEMLICVSIVPRARDGTSVLTFSCVHRRGPVGFYPGRVLL